MKTFKEFINESVKDLLKPKSEEEIKKQLKSLNVFDRIYKIQKYDLYGNIYNNLLPTKEELEKELKKLGAFDQIRMIDKYDLDKSLMPSVKEMEKAYLKDLEEGNKEHTTLDTIKYAIKHQLLNLLKKALDKAKNGDLTHREGELIQIVASHKNMKIIELLRKRFKKNWSSVKNKQNVDNTIFYSLVLFRINDEAIKFYNKTKISEQTKDITLKSAILNINDEIVDFLLSVGVKPSDIMILHSMNNRTYKILQKYGYNDNNNEISNKYHQEITKKYINQS